MRTKISVAVEGCDESLNLASAEVVGAWATMAAPGRMQRFAARN